MNNSNATPREYEVGRCQDNLQNNPETSFFPSTSQCEYISQTLFPLLCDFVSKGRYTVDVLCGLLKSSKSSLINLYGCTATDFLAAISSMDVETKATVIIRLVAGLCGFREEWLLGEFIKQPHGPIAYATHKEQEVQKNQQTPVPLAPLKLTRPRPPAIRLPVTVPTVKCEFLARNTADENDFQRNGCSKTDPVDLGFQGLLSPNYKSEAHNRSVWL